MSTKRKPRIPTTALDMLQLPPVEWSRLAETLAKRGKLSGLWREFDAIAERAARLSAYLDARGGAGSGDGGHAAGVKHQNIKGRRVRKALGYSVTRPLDF